MNFIELRVEDYIDEVLDTENGDHAAEVQVLRKFVKYLDRETEVYSVQEITQTVALDFLRILRDSRERRTAVAALNGFFADLHQKGHNDQKLHLVEDDLFAGKKVVKGSTPDLLGSDDGSDMPRHRHRRDMD